MIAFLQGPASGKFKSQSNYNSAFKFNNHNHVSVRMGDDDVLDRKAVQPSWSFYITTYTFTFLSYLIFILTLPFTYWFFVKKLGEFDRLVVFRLGKMIGRGRSKSFSNQLEKALALSDMDSFN